MTAPKTLPNEYEKAIKEAALSIKQLEDVRDLLPLAAYRAAQRDALRKLAKAIVVQSELPKISAVARQIS